TWRCRQLHSLCTHGLTTADNRFWPQTTTPGAPRNAKTPEKSGVSCLHNPHLGAGSSLFSLWKYFFQRHLPLPQAQRHHHRIPLVIHANHLAALVELRHVDAVSCLQTSARVAQHRRFLRLAVDLRQLLLQLLLAPLRVGLGLERLLARLLGFGPLL